MSVEKLVITKLKSIYYYAIVLLEAVLKCPEVEVLIAD